MGQKKEEKKTGMSVTTSQQLRGDVFLETFNKCFAEKEKFHDTEEHQWITKVLNTMLDNM